MELAPFTDTAWRLRVLTKGQRRVLLCLSHGYNQREVAELLDVCEDTVRSHTKSIRDRLVAKNTAHAVAIALRNGMIE